MTTEQKRAYSRAYYQENKHYWRQFYETHRSECIQKATAYYFAHKTAINAKKKRVRKPTLSDEERKNRKIAYRRAHKAEQSVYYKLWYEKNREALAIRRREKRNQDKSSAIKTEPHS